LDVIREGWFPAGLTAHEGVERLLPNHYLDLDSWSVQRYWPRADITATESPEDCVHSIVELVRRQLEALTQAPEFIAQALTAGHETRALLACAREIREQVTFVTVTGSDRHACDTAMAQRIAGDLGLQHRELPRVTASPEQQELFRLRGGHCVGDSNVLYHPSVWPLAENHFFVGGLGGEVGRAFLWRDSDNSQTRLSAATLIGRMGLLNLPVISTRLEQWLQALPLTDSLQVLDLAYIEHRMGPWSSAQFYNDPTLVRFAPLVTRRALEMLISLPPEWKRNNLLLGTIIGECWPDLDKYPYNSRGFLRDNLVKLQKALENPGIVVKKIRKSLRVY
jgi:hypothetical protein